MNKNGFEKKSKGLQLLEFLSLWAVPSLEVPSLFEIFVGYAIIFLRFCFQVLCFLGALLPLWASTEWTRSMNHAEFDEKLPNGKRYFLRTTIVHHYIWAGPSEERTFSAPVQVKKQADSLMIFVNWFSY